MIQLTEIEKTLKDKNRTTKALSNVSLSIKSGEMIAIAGESGSGKSTLLSILGGMQSADNGIYLYGNEQMPVEDVRKMEAFRREKVGVIVQNFALIPFFTVYENIELPLKEQKVPKNLRREKVLSALCEVGLDGFENAYPDQLSGGEQQRVAICRAMVRKPELLLADEPTGSLDEENEKNILYLLRKLANADATVVIATHSKEVISCCDRTIWLRKGKVVEKTNAQ